jgi:hypothetical protein
MAGDMLLLSTTTHLQVFADTVHQHVTLVLYTSVWQAGSGAVQA